MTRVLVLGLLGFLLLTLLGPLLRMIGFELVGVDVATVIVLHVSMTERRPLFGHGGDSRLFGCGLQSTNVLLALVLGYCSDLLGGSIKGIHTFALAVLYLVGRATSRQVSLVGGLSQFLVAFAASLLASVTALLVRWVVGVPPGAGIVMVIFGQATFTALVAPPLFRLLRWIDLKLSHDTAERGTLHIG